MNEIEIQRMGDKSLFPIFWISISPKRSITQSLVLSFYKTTKEILLIIISKKQKDMKKLIAFFAVLALVAVASPAFAYGNYGNYGSSDINVTVNSSGSVTNTVKTKADTGGNTSVGGKAKSKAYAGGNTSVGGDTEKGKADASFSGDADSSSTGGNGGTINTGNAVSTTSVANVVNSNDIKVKTDCECRGEVNASLTSSAVITNTVKTKADTGGNTSVGGKAKSKAYAGGNTSVGGDTEKGGAYASFSGDADSSSTGGNGGVINTGNSEALSLVENYVNTNIVRIRR